MNLNILFEDNHLIVINKEPSQLVQGDQTGDPSLDHVIKEYLKKKYNKPGKVFLGVVHRLDRPVSGVVVFARTSKALQRMNRKFKDHEIKKKYWAIVESAPSEPEATLVHHLKRNRKMNKSMAYDSPQPLTKEASLTYRISGQSRHYYFMDITLHTGRHHQIRSQLAAIGCTIKGDLKYGARRSNPDGGICLHARELEFIHPVQNKTVTIIAEPPDEPLWQIFKDTSQ